MSKRDYSTNHKPASFLLDREIAAQAQRNGRISKSKIYSWKQIGKNIKHGECVSLSPQEYAKRKIQEQLDAL